MKTKTKTKKTKARHIERDVSFKILFKKEQR